MSSNRPIWERAWINIKSVVTAVAFIAVTIITIVLSVWAVPIILIVLGLLIGFSMIREYYLDENDEEGP